MKKEEERNEESKCGKRKKVRVINWRFEICESHANRCLKPLMMSQNILIFKFFKSREYICVYFFKNLIENLFMRLF